MKTSDQNMEPAMQREEALFQAALQLTGAERAAFLDGACRGDPMLRRRLDALLAAHERPDHLLATAAPAARPTLKLNSTGAQDEAIGTTIGRYRLLERLGEGGCGVVYMADQQEPIRRRVALKVIKMGMDTKSVIARFEAERQALAMMDHPNIAKVLDAGATESGRPYFVMELVRGIKATDYCDQHKLTTRQRIGLFIQICQAVQHAHQKGLIHRDLKPSNILVSSADGVPVPKVIDFGIAKATNQQPLTDKSLFTAFAQFIGTPAYMSPEQAELSALDIDTRTDIYSLGVLLYELLTGQPPFAPETLVNAGLDEMRRIIREIEPPKPSTRIETELTRNPQSTVRITELKEVRGDLDWIVMKCLEKDRTRRYETANGLAADLQRHLENQPVEARPPSAAYRLEKAWRRHRLAYGAGAAVAVALVLGITVSAWQAVRATRAEAAAVRAQNAAQEQRLRANANAAEAQKQAVEARKESDRADANARRSSRGLYVADMRLAQQAWEDARMVRLQELLDGQRPERTTGVDLRGFEWYYWHRLAHTDLFTVKDGSGCSVAFSPDGKHLATSGYNRKLKIYDASTGQELLSLVGHRGNVWAVAFSPDGTRLASATGEFGSPAQLGEMKLWDASTGKEILSFEGHASSVTALSFSPHGKILASSGADRTVRLWDTTTGQEMLNVAIGHALAHSVAFSPDGKRFATGTDSENFNPGEVKVWEATTGKPVFTCKGSRRVFSVAFSPDGRLLAAGGSEGIKVWDATDGGEAIPLRGAGSASARGLVFSSDNRFLAAGFGNIVKIWETANGSEKASYQGHSRTVLSVAFNPEGTRLASGDGWDVKVWDTLSSQEASTLKFAGAGAGGTAVSFSPTGERLATARWDGAVKILEATTLREILSCKAPGSSGKGPVARCVAFSPDGQRLASGGDGPAIGLWDAASGREILTLPEPSGKVNGVAFSPDGKRLASACGDSSQQSPRGAVKIWDATTGQELLSLIVPSRDRNRPAFTSVVFSPDGRLLAAGVTQHVRENGEYVAGETVIWDTVTGQVKFALADVHHVKSVAFSPDGKRLVSAGISTMKIWDATTGQEICTLKGHTGDINSVAFSPDGNRVASASDDTTVRVWDATSGQETLVLKGHIAQVYSVAFSPDGRRLASVGQDGTLRVWEGARSE